jgi:cytochrome c-type biogenesis protein CcmE
MSPRQRRAAVVIAGLLCLGATSALVLNAFRSNLVFFFSPSDIAQHKAPRDRSFRVGGLVAEGSVHRDLRSLTVRFVVTDRARSTPVVYTGVLPDLFSEGKGVVAQGRLREGIFHAEQVLAKHDENYMPRDAADALERAGASLRELPP